MSFFSRSNGNSGTNGRPSNGYSGSNGRSSNGRSTNGQTGSTGNLVSAFIQQRNTLRSDLTRIVQLLTGRHQPPNETQLFNEVSEILASVSDLSDAAPRMLEHSTPQDIRRVGEMWFFNEELQRSGGQYLTEFEWACEYTISSLRLLRRYVSNHMAIGNIARNIQMQVTLWEMRDSWPQVLPEQDPSMEVRVTGLHRLPPSRGFR